MLGFETFMIFTELVFMHNTAEDDVQHCKLQESTKWFVRPYLVIGTGVKCDFV